MIFKIKCYPQSNFPKISTGDCFSLETSSKVYFLDWSCNAKIKEGTMTLNYYFSQSLEEWFKMTDDQIKSNHMINRLEEGETEKFIDFWKMVKPILIKKGIFDTIKKTNKV